MADRLKSFVIRTPLLRIQQQVFLKLENLQCLGSYKIRGIAAVVQQHESLLKECGIAVASAGNMALAAAFAAQHYHLPCHLYLPESAPRIKKERLKTFSVQMEELPFEKFWEMVVTQTIPHPTAYFIHPALNDTLLAGYRSIAEEIIADLPEMDAIVIPFGVGGLTQALVSVLHEYNPNISIYVSEPETAAPLQAALKVGQVVKIARQSSFVDAIGTSQVLAPVFARIHSRIKASLVVSIQEAQQAMKTLLFNHKLVCEGAAACAFAATMKLVAAQRYQKIVCLISGGNVDFELLK